MIWNVEAVINGLPMLKKPLIIFLKTTVLEIGTAMQTIFLTATVDSLYIRIGPVCHALRAQIVNISWYGEMLLIEVWVYA